MSKINELKRLCEGATSGSWSAERYEDKVGYRWTIKDAGGRHIAGTSPGRHEFNNVHLIAQSRNELPALLDHLESMHKALNSCLQELWDDRHSHMSSTKFREDLSEEYAALDGFDA